MLLFGLWFLLPLLGIELLMFVSLLYKSHMDEMERIYRQYEEGVYEMYLPPVDTISPDTITELKDSLGTSRIELAPEN